MTGFDEATIEEIKARTDLAELIESYGVQVKTAGASKKACCPFHHEKTPSFNINESKGFYHCFGCGESGDAIKFVEKMEGLSFLDAVKKLAARCGVKLEEKHDPEAGKRKRLLALMAELSQFYRRCLLKMGDAQIARDYLAKRDLSEEVGEQWKIGYAPVGAAAMLKWAEKYGYAAEELERAGVIIAPKTEGDNGYHRFGGRLMFSICDRQGRVVAFSGRQLVASKKSGKYVNSPETDIFKKSKILFGFDKAAANIAKSAHHEAIVCEGQIDTIRLHISGFPIAVASQGTAFTEEHVKMLKKVADQVVLVFDDDAAGHKATIRTAGLFLAEEMPVRVVSLPGGDDPDSFLRSHPKEEFQKLLDNAESIVSFQVRTQRAAEANPNSVDATNRVSKQVIATIAQSKNSVVKASMAAEAAKLLDLPAIAVQEELAKVKLQPKVPMVPPKKEQASPDDIEDAFDVEAADDEEPLDDQVGIGEDAANAVRPSSLELSFCELLMANQYDRTLDGMVGEFVPPTILEHDFTRRFVEEWRAEVNKGEDMLAAWGETLNRHEQEWFAGIMNGHKKPQYSGLEATDNMQTSIASLWQAHLRRLQGALPAKQTGEESKRAIMLAQWQQKLKRSSWEESKEMISNWLAEEVSRT